MAVARVELLTEVDAPLLARPFYAGGDPGPIVAALATVPELLEATLPFVGAALGASSVPVRAKELAILRASACQECRYCVQAHSVVSLDVGLTLDEVRALRGELLRDEVFTDPAERALLAWVDAMATSVGPLPEPVADRLAAHWPGHHVVELTMVVAATIMLNRFCTALDLPTAPATWQRLVDVGLA